MTAVNVEGHVALNEGGLLRVRYRSHCMEITLNLRGLFTTAAGRARAFKRVGLACCAGALLASAAGCIVVPADRHGAYGRGGGGGSAVYVEPGYASPGPGWMWQSHPRYGYGWRHPHRGWHRGWR